MTAPLDEAITRPSASAEVANRGESEGGGRSGAPPTERGEWLFLVGLALAVSWVVVTTRWGTFTPDTRPDLYQDPGRFLASSVQAWVGGASGLGQSNFNAGAAPVALVVWVIRALGAPAWLAVRLWRLLLIGVAAWGIRRYLGALYGPRLSVAGRVVVTVFWVANPYIIVAGNTTPILLPYALLPWTMLPFLESTRHPRSWRWPALFALAFFAQTGLNAGVVSFFQLLALPGHLIYARWAEHRSWKPLLGSLVRCGSLSLLVSLYWLAPSFLAAGTGAGIAESTENPVDVARTGSYAETARLLGHWPLYGRAGDRLFMGGYASFVDNPFVVVCSFLLVVAVGASLLWGRARERLLAVGLIAAGLPAMVGMFPPDDPYPAGSVLKAVFDAVPAALAFRTTNKAGAVVVLGYAVALAAGVRAWERRRPRTPRARFLGALGAGIVLVGASGPMWNGQLYPLGYDVPGHWVAALDDLDGRNDADRVLVIPGGTGGNYRWGMRSPDDLFQSFLDRPVALRNTVVGRGSPSGNFLAGFDTELAEGTLPDGSISTMARYLGAADVLVRNDLLTEEWGGPTPAGVERAVADDPGLEPVDSYGVEGTDTMPGYSGPATDEAREADPADAAVQPLSVHAVEGSTPVLRIAPVDDQVIVDGDGSAFTAMTWAGLLAATPTVRYLGELDADGLAEALHDGSRVVLTDTNRRRAWDINRVTNATSATLGVDDDIDAGNGATATLWPDDPDRQTVTEVEGAASISADLPAFGLHPYGRPGQALDGDPTTAWQTGALGTARGAALRVVFDTPQIISSIGILPSSSSPSYVTSVQVEVGDELVVHTFGPAAGTEPIDVPIQPTRADTVTITLLGQTGGNNPVGLAEVEINDIRAAEVTRLPRTLSALIEGAPEATLAALAEAPIDVIFTRARGRGADLNDDEERQIDRRFELPDDRSYTFTAELALSGADPSLVALLQANADDGTCRTVAMLDGQPLEARIPDGERGAGGTFTVEGCAPLELSAGPHELTGLFGWRLDRVHLASESSESSTSGATDAGAADDAVIPPVGDPVRIVERTATRVEAEVDPVDEDRFLRLGEAYDPRWTLLADGRDLGEPILLDGYSTGWRIPAGAERLSIEFGPQSAVRVTFAASALAVAGTLGVALLPVPVVLADRRRGVRRAGRSSRRRSVGSEP